MTSLHTRRVGVIMNGVTGRMGANQHLLRSIVPIIRQGGVALDDGERLMPDPILVGRNPAKLESLAARAGVSRWTTDLDAALANTADTVYFDAQTTDRRAESVARALAAGKHIYAEKPSASSTAEALDLHRLAVRAGVVHGVVQDKLWLPGFLKLRRLRDQNFFGRILAVRAEFGYWVFEGDVVPAQRPSWNYRREDGGGMVMDMFCHWRYLLDNLFGAVRAVSCSALTHIPRRWNEQNQPYDCTADDAAYATFELDGGVIAQFNASWATRVRRDDLLSVQVDGTDGSAVAGLRQCWIQPRAATPRAVWNPDVESPVNYFAGWTEVPDLLPADNAFKVQWELFLKSVAAGQPFPWNLLEGAKGVQLAEKGLESSQKRAWVTVPNLTDNDESERKPAP